MPIIKLDATGSTNTFIRDLLKETKLDDYTVVWTDYQYAGRGQRERSWHSEKGKNLIISILKLHNGLGVQAQFDINRAVSLAILQTLSELNIPDLKVKWPNDILSGDAKLCGILIENSIKGSKLKHSIIGIGLNVNQIQFEGLPNACSLTQISGETYDRDLLLYQLVSAVKAELDLNDGQELAGQKERYENYLYRRGQTVSFEHASGIFDATVEGVTDSGKLKLALQNGKSACYAKGEIRWLTA